MDKLAEVNPADRSVQNVLNKVAPALVAGIRILLDYAMIVLGVKLAYWLRQDVIPLVYPEFGVPWLYRDVIIPVAFLFFLHFDRREVLGLYFWQQAERLFKGTIYAVLAVVLMMYFGGISGEISRVFMGLVWLSCFSLLLLGRYCYKKILVRVDCLKRPVIIIGAGKTAELLLRSFPNHLGTGYRIIGFIEDKPENSGICGKYPLLGGFAQVEKIVDEWKVRNVLIAAPGLDRENLLRIVYRLQPYVDHITFVPDLFGVPVTGMRVETLFNEKTVLLKITNNLAQRHNRLLKWAFDCVLSLLGLLFFVPAFAVIALMIYIESPGPVIFAHRRVGANGESFPCYKFRTMVINAQEVLKKHLADDPKARTEWECDFKLRNDPRITRCGAFLRKTSLDELPQFLNVLKGEMSLVGPRPIVQEEVAKYAEQIHDYYMVKPGVTGIWQVSGRNDVDYTERVQMDSWYVRNWSLWMDIVIIIKTIGVVLKRKGAY